MLYIDSVYSAGLPAEEIHLCGHESALPLVRRLARTMGDQIEVTQSPTHPHTLTHVPLVLCSQVCRYERLSPLVPLNHSLEGDFKNVSNGDCVVIFSREKLFRIRRKIETATNKPCAVIYGGLPSGMYMYIHPVAVVLFLLRICVYYVLCERSVAHSCALSSVCLPPATRVRQAELFNSSDNPCDIMVATDAIGMGLNLYVNVQM